MAHERNSDEVKSHHIEHMGEELGVLYNALYNEVVWQYVKWNEYNELYGKNESRVELLNKVSPLFFKIIKDALWEDTLLPIARITDPPKSVGKANLSIQRLPALVDNEIKSTIESLIINAKEKSAFCRDWRNRIIAHKDLELAIDEQAEPLQKASRVKIKEALSSIAAILNLLAHHYMDTTIMFDGFTNPHNSLHMLYVLNDGLETEVKGYIRNSQRMIITSGLAI